MGNSNQSSQFLQRGQGLRILQVKPNSPFQNKVQPFFDFIVDVIPLLTAQQKMDNTRPQTVKKGFNQMMAQSQSKNVQVKVVSTKYRNVRSIMVNPNRNWNGSNDLTGIIFRKQKFDEVFDTYFPVSEIILNSPVHLAGIKQGEYLVGCVEFSYATLDKLIEGLYDRFFDKEVTDKSVHFALYDMLSDRVILKRVLLKRGWGGNGLLGCEFLQGQLYKFPLNLKERREHMLQNHYSKVQNQQFKSQLTQCNGVSKQLAEALKNRQTKRQKHIQTIRNMISIPLPQIPEPTQLKSQQQPSLNQEARLYQQSAKIQFLQKRVANLQQTLFSIRQYIEIISSQEQTDDKAIQQTPKTVNQMTRTVEN